MILKNQDSGRDTTLNDITAKQLAYVDVVQIKVGKFLMETNYLEYLHMYLQEYCAAIRDELARRAAVQKLREK